MEHENYQEISDEQALKELKKGYKKAEKILNDRDKFDDTIERLEEKLKTIPKIGGKLASVPVFIQLVKCYMTKQYTLVPIGSVIAIVSALMYVLSPIDLIPDFIPVFGYLDDAAVVAICLKLVQTDINEFLLWRDSNKHIIVIE